MNRSANSLNLKKKTETALEYYFRLPKIDKNEKFLSFGYCQDVGE